MSPGIGGRDTARQHTRWRRTARIVSMVAGLLVAGGTACSGPAPASPGTTAGGPPRSQYVALADAVIAHGAHVWVEADLVKAWQAGTVRYRQVLDTVVAFAARPGVLGVKVADELGYHDGLDAGHALDFLTTTSAALHSALPDRKVLIDVIVPSLGCLSWESAAGKASPGARGWAAAPPDARAGMRECSQREDAKNPGATLAAVDSYVARGGIDVLDLSAGLRADSEYTAWRTTRDTAMTAIWVEASRRWGGHVTLQARKALAHPGLYGRPAAAAERDVHTFVDIPLAHGAAAVDIWSWSQTYQSTTYRLTDPGLADNPLIVALRARREKGADLWTHMTPSSLQRGVQADVAAATALFGTVLVTSGTG